MDLIFADFDPAQALDAIVSWDQTRITTRTAPDLPAYLNLEALAQTCGLHLRRRNDFRIQAFLVSVTGLVYPPSAVQAAWTITACLQTETSNGAGYQVEIDGLTGCRLVMGRRDLPPGHVETCFQERFQWLCTRSCSN